MDRKICNSHEFYFFTNNLFSFTSILANTKIVSTHHTFHPLYNIFTVINKAHMDFQLFLVLSILKKENILPHKIFVESSRGARASRHLDYPRFNYWYCGWRFWSIFIVNLLFMSLTITRQGVDVWHNHNFLNELCQWCSYSGWYFKAFFLFKIKVHFMSVIGCIIEFEDLTK